MDTEDRPMNEDLQHLDDFEKRIIEGGGRKATQKEFDEVLKTMRGAYLIPEPTESAAVAIGREKTAALFYDRIWSPYASLVPYDMHFFGASEPERTALLHVVFREQKEKPEPETFTEFFREQTKEMVSASYSIQPDGSWKQERMTTLQRLLVEALWREHKTHVVAIYPSEKEQDKDFRAGDQRAIVSLLTDVPLPIESELSWEQVAELRKDSDARMKCRRLLHWLDDKMIAKSHEFVADHIAVTLANYETSLRKHGVKTALSALAGTFSAVSVPTVVAHLTQQPLWMLLVEGVLIGTGAMAKAAEKYIDSRPDAPDEVAWVYKVKQRMKKG